MKSSSARYREVTLAAVALGVVLGMLMTAAFVYIGLKLGFGLPGSTVAAIAGFALLRGMGRRAFRVPGCGSIVENNINQTIASGVNTASAGVVFTFPALLLLGENFDVGSILLAAMAGSFMGIVVIIPLRKQLIEIERLRFPTGVAVASILKAPGAGMHKAKLMGVGFVVSAAITLSVGEHVHLIPDTLPLGAWAGSLLGPRPGSAFELVLQGTALSLSTASFGAGMLSGKGGLPFALGGMLAWWFVGPFAVARGWSPPGLAGDELVGAVYGTMLRPTGIGVLIGGALAGVVAAFPAIRGALSSLISASRLARQTHAEAEELSAKTLLIGLVASFVALLLVAGIGTQQAGGFSLGTTLAVGIVGTLWIALAGLIVAQATGATDISPLSGLALIAVTLILAIAAKNVVLAITVGVAVCIATSQCADMMTDLKTGHLVGGIPRRQQLVQFAVAWIGPAIAIGTTLLLWKSGPGGAGGFGPESQACASASPSCLPAPQAGVLQGMVQGVLTGNAPVDKYVAGAGIGAALGLFPVGGLGVLVGLAMYLPFHITLGYALGCGTSIVLTHRKGQLFFSDVLVPIAAGLIVGEALTSLSTTLYQLSLAGGR